MQGCDQHICGKREHLSQHAAPFPVLRKEIVWHLEPKCLVICSSSTATGLLLKAVADLSKLTPRYIHHLCIKFMVRMFCFDHWTSVPPMKTFDFSAGLLYLRLAAFTLHKLIYSVFKVGILKQLAHY